MTHDPLCPLDDSPRTRMLLTPFRVCCCSLIAHVRADERKQAGARVAALTHWEDGWPENVVVNRVPAIDAAEGGDGE